MRGSHSPEREGAPLEDGASADRFVDEEAQPNDGTMAGEPAYAAQAEVATMGGDAEEESQSAAFDPRNNMHEVEAVEGQGNETDAQLKADLSQQMYTTTATVPPDVAALSIDTHLENTLADPQSMMEAMSSGHYTNPATPARSFVDPMLDQPTASPMALENTPSLPVSTYGSALSGPQSLQMTSPTQDPEGPQIQAFAKLEFEDGPYYMNTYSIELGRDVRAAKLALNQASRSPEKPGRDTKRKSSSMGDAPQTPAAPRKEEASQVPHSVVSDRGGIMGMDSVDEEEKKKSPWSNGMKRGNRKTKSTSSSSQQLSRKNSYGVPGAQEPSTPGAFSQRTSGAHPVDPLSLLPSPDECPLLAIHPPANSTGSHNSISRKHVKIFYNFESRQFELLIMGRNGAFINDRFHAAQETIPLENSSNIQIGAVHFRFALPDIPGPKTEGETGPDPFADVESIGLASESESDFGSIRTPVSDQGIGGFSYTSSSGDDEREDDGEEGVEYSDEEIALQAKDESDLEEDEEEEEEMPSEPTQPKKRGPGRPPKNGISKREQAQIAREVKAKAREEAAANAASKNKANRPRKGTLQEESPPKPEKRKYTKRKSVSIDASAGTRIDSVQAEGEQANDEKASKKKEKKPPKSPRSPTPEFDADKLPPEALEKPQASYVVLIHEALTNSKTGAMSLPQIYKAIQRKYPYFVLRTTTNGWQSSVRHNLGQHQAFRKIERSGKGWLWAITPGVSIEKEKKRRSSPPVHTAKHYVQQPHLGPGQSQASQPMMHVLPGGANRQPGGRDAPGSNGTKGPPSFPAQAFPNGALRPAGTYQSPYSTTPDPKPPGNNHAAGSLKNGKPPSVPAQASAGKPGPAGSQNQPPTGAGGRPSQLNPQLIGAVSDFKMALIKRKPNDKRLEQIVNSAINRGLGLSDKSTVPGGEDPQEIQIMNALWNIMRSCQTSFAKTNNNTQAPPPPSSKAKPANPPPPHPSQHKPPPGRPPAPAAATPSTASTPTPAPRPGANQPGSDDASKAHLLRLLQHISKRRTSTPSPGGAQGSPGHPQGQQKGSQPVSRAPSVTNGQGSPEPAVGSVGVKRNFEAVNSATAGAGKEGDENGEHRAKRPNVTT